MIDTHAHLNFNPLLGQVDQVVAQARQAGLTAIVVASSSLTDSEKSLELAQHYPGFLLPAVGLHPQKTDPESQLAVTEQLQQLELLITHHRSLVVAIGETGLDFSPAPPGEVARTLPDQRELFLGQIRLAKDYQLPLIIHARQALDEVLQILEATSPRRGVFHCYAGGRKRLPKIQRLPGEWYCGFAGNLTYEAGLAEVVKAIPEERILLETDAPFLAPLPYRGQTNSPAYLPLIQKRLAEIRGRPTPELIQQNSLRLFSGCASDRGCI